jgi:hypothetical protein
MKIVNVIVIALCLVAIVSCSKKEKNQSGEWKELDAFHEIMAASYHPLMDSGNVEPAKKLINKMADEAEKWSASPLPEKVDNDKVKANLEKLKTDTRALADEIKNGATDDVVKEKLTALHTLFHHLSEAWHDKPEHEESGEEHKH